SSSRRRLRTSSWSRTGSTDAAGTDLGARLVAPAGPAGSAVAVRGRRRALDAGARRRLLARSHAGAPHRPARAPAGGRVHALALGPRLRRGRDRRPRDRAQPHRADALLFLGDCLCASPREVLTVERALPLYDRILSYPAERYVEGHHPAMETRAELEELIEKARA